MTATRRLAILGAAFASAALAPRATAQGPETIEQPLAALHRAWISEVLDLDTAGAAAQYARVAREGRSAQPERWVAAARLAELQRMGVTTPPAPGLVESPAALRSAWAEVQPRLEVDGLLQRLHDAPTVTLPELAGDGHGVPELRPLVPKAESWLLAQTGPSLRDRRRQRMQAFANLSRSPQVSNYLQRLYAATIVNAEVNGRRSQADALRALYFATWRPPVTAEEPEAVVAHALTELDTWLGEEEVSPQQRMLLGSLRDHLARKAAIDPREARDLIARLPRYAERLLGGSDKR
ncbi:MAG: hypothetical protein H6838_19990 [Planctomycetes bacterium]|nr:hypothetical protein [Planctomycetota bacterium]